MQAVRAGPELPGPRGSVTVLVLRAVAFRILGSAHDAEDAVQEAWLRLNSSGPGEVRNLGAWLTTVVGRICLDMRRSQ